MRNRKWTMAMLAAVTGLVVGAAVPGRAQTQTVPDDAVDDAYVEPAPILSDVIEWNSKQADAVRSGGRTAGAMTTAAAATCDVSGKQIEFVYAVPSDRSNQYSTRATTIRGDAAAMQSWLRREAGPRRDQTFRFCTTGGIVAVNNVSLSAAVGTDGVITSGEIKNDLVNAGYNSIERKYVVYVETNSLEVIGCGDGTSHGCTEGKRTDASASIDNLNNSGPAYAILTVYHLSRLKTAMHELFHALGALQLGSPGYSTSSHTKTGVELMTGGPTQYHCDPGDNPNGDSLAIDCGKDDYYSTLCAIDKSRCPGPNGTFGSSVYLATAFNIAQYSQFLDPIALTALDAMTCFGVTPTLLEEHSESWSGGSLNDAVWGGDGFDLLQGFSGNDSLCGGAGNDQVQGGGSDDSVAGSGGEDDVRGGPGNDTIRGNDHDDKLYDGLGTDVIEGGAGTDTLYQCADSVNDTITGVEVIQPASSTYC